jgi:hypothetical protein
MGNLRYIKKSTDQVVRQLSGYNSYGELLCDTGKKACMGASGLFDFIGDLVDELFMLARPTAVPAVQNVKIAASKTCFRCNRKVTAHEDGFFQCSCGRRFR